MLDLCPVHYMAFEVPFGVVYTPVSHHRCAYIITTVILLDMVHTQEEQGKRRKPKT
jgi:hypothetical protein